MTVRERLEEAGFEDVLIFDEPSYDDAFLGVTLRGVAVYSYEKMVEYLVKEMNMSTEEAEEFITWNDSFHQFGQPIVVCEI